METYSGIILFSFDAFLRLLIVMFPLHVGDSILYKGQSIRAPRLFIQEFHQVDQTLNSFSKVPVHSKTSVSTTKGGEIELIIWK